jgi:hypothetical protein
VPLKHTTASCAHENEATGEERRRRRGTMVTCCRGQTLVTSGGHSHDARGEARRDTASRRRRAESASKRRSHEFRSSQACRDSPPPAARNNARRLPIVGGPAGLQPSCQSISSRRPQSLIPWLQLFLTRISYHAPNSAPLPSCDICLTRPDYQSILKACVGPITAPTAAGHDRLTSSQYFSPTSYLQQPLPPEFLGQHCSTAAPALRPP